MIKDSFKMIPSDIFKHLLSFCNSKDKALISTIDQDSYHMTKQYQINTAENIAWIDDNGVYHVQYISPSEKEHKSIDFKSMTYINEETKSTEYLLIDECDDHESFDWTMFIKRQHRGIDLHQTKGYWKILNNDHYMIHDLNCIKSMLLHPKIAHNMLCDVDTNQNPFKQRITVYIHGIDNHKPNAYDILFWNGASPNQVHTLQLYDHQRKRHRFFMHFKSPQHSIRWHWYDNDRSRFKEYDLGFKVTAQIECSFQANLLYNFPMQFQKEGIFNNVNLTQLKMAYVERFGCAHKHKVFVLRCSFDEKDGENRNILSVEQLTVSNYAFPRNMLRVDCAKGDGERDFCHEVEGKFNLRKKRERKGSENAL